MDVVEHYSTSQRDIRQLMVIDALYDVPGTSPGDFLAFQATVVATDAEY